MNGPQRFRRCGPLLEIAPGPWINVAGVTAVLPADSADGEFGLTVVEADGRPYRVRPVPAVVARAVADAMLDWAGERAQAEEDGRWLARERAGEAFRDRDRPRGWEVRPAPTRTDTLEAPAVTDRQARRDRRGEWG